MSLVKGWGVCQGLSFLRPLDYNFYTSQPHMMSVAASQLCYFRCESESKSWTLSPYCLDSSLVSLKRFFKVSRPSFSCQQACQLLWEVEISSNCWTQCCHLVGYNLSVRNLELWFILSRNVGIIVLKLFYIYFVHACSVVSNSEQIDPGIDLVGTKIFTVRKKIQSR